MEIQIKTGYTSLYTVIVLSRIYIKNNIKDLIRVEVPARPGHGGSGATSTCVQDLRFLRQNLGVGVYFSLLIFTLLEGDLMFQRVLLTVICVLLGLLVYTVHNKAFTPRFQLSGSGTVVFDTATGKLYCVSQRFTETEVGGVMVTPLYPIAHVLEWPSELTHSQHPQNDQNKP